MAQNITGNVARSPQSEFDPSDPLGSFVDVLRRVVLHPVDFFAALPRREGLRNPFLFALICIVIGAVLNAVLDLIGLQSSFQSNEQMLEPLGLSSQSVAGFAAYILIYVAILIVALPIGAGIYQLLVRLAVGRENAGFGATFRVLAYVQALQVVGWIPILGLLATLYGLYLQVVGLREVHETTTGRAILVFVLGGVVAILVSALMFIVFAILIAALAS